MKKLNTLTNNRINKTNPKQQLKNKTNNSSRPLNILLKFNHNSNSNNKEKKQKNKFLV